MTTGPACLRQEAVSGEGGVTTKNVSNMLLLHRHLNIPLSLHNRKSTMLSVMLHRGKGSRWFINANGLSLPKETDLFGYYISDPSI